MYTFSNMKITITLDSMNGRDDSETGTTTTNGCDDDERVRRR